MNPYVFIVGCPRSGTTLLQRMVDAHPEIAITHEQHWIPRFFRKPKLVSTDGVVKRELVDALFERMSGRMKQVHLSRSDVERLLEGGDRVSFASFVTAIFNHHGQRQGKTIVGDKSPGYVRDLPLLHGLWPKAKFVHLIRDGRDVCLSTINWQDGDHIKERLLTWDDDPVVSLALWWKWNVERGREDGQTLGNERYCEVRYEALIANPEAEARKLCNFLAVEFDDSMLRFHEGRTKTDPALDAKAAWKPIMPGLRDWRTQMKAGALQRFEAAVGEVLEEFGYPRSAFPADSELAGNVARLKDKFTAHAHSKNYNLPTNWSAEKISPGWSDAHDSRCHFMNPFVFMVGCPRSGTTLLQRMVDAHPQIAIAHEQRWILRFLKDRRGLRPDGTVTEEIVRDLFSNMQFPMSHLGVTRAEMTGLIAGNGSLGYRDFVSKIFDLHAQWRGKLVAGDKTPTFVLRMGELHKLWPEARFVHIIRDGRDVSLSMLNWSEAYHSTNRLPTFDSDRVTTLALWWKWHVLKGQESGESLGPALYHELKYETLLAHPEEECGKLCEFLGFRFHQDMLQFHEGRTKSDAGLSAKDAWKPITPGLRNWSTEMPAADLEKFEAVAGDLLSQLGYARAVPNLSPAPAEYASRFRERFIALAPSKGKTLPRGWKTAAADTAAAVEVF